MEATGNENVSNLYFGSIVAMELNLSSKTRNSISPYPIAKFLRAPSAEFREILRDSYF